MCVCKHLSMVWYKLTLLFLFFKQKTAYEMRISDWSSDVCSSDLASLAACAEQVTTAVAPDTPGFLLGLWHGFIFPVAWVLSLFMSDVAIYAVPKIGRASCRERVCQYV